MAVGFSSSLFLLLLLNERLVLKLVLQIWLAEVISLEKVSTFHEI